MGENKQYCSGSDLGVLPILVNVSIYFFLTIGHDVHIARVKAREYQNNITCSCLTIRSRSGAPEKSFVSQVNCLRSTERWAEKKTRTGRTEIRIQGIKASWKLQVRELTRLTPQTLACFKSLEDFHIS